MEINSDYIKGIFSQDTGGNCIVDFVELKNGMVIGINDECVCVYKDMDAFNEWREDACKCVDLIDFGKTY